MKALVIGGTGPSGHYIVNGLLRRGYEVAMLHSGKHEVAEIPATVEHIHTDAFSAEAFQAAIDGRTFDLTVAAYGRLRRIAEIMVGRTGRFISIGGVPAYRGYMNPAVLEPLGLPVPTAEDAPVVPVEAEDAKGWRVAQTEQAVFEQHPQATHFRYPFLYGAYQIAPREWCIVRRILDRPAFDHPAGGRAHAESFGVRRECGACDFARGRSAGGVGGANLQLRRRAAADAAAGRRDYREGV